MPTITIRLDQETDTRLKRRLVRSGESLSEFVRAAIIKQLGTGPVHESPYDAWVRLVRGCTGSGETDRSTTYKTRIREKLRAKHRR
jgi:Arc/MetJ-type ribon-helix-helix transcriptional regulator